jgi:hypothetical protein
VTKEKKVLKCQFLAATPLKVGDIVVVSSFDESSMITMRPEMLKVLAEIEQCMCEMEPVPLKSLPEKDQVMLLSNRSTFPLPEWKKCWNII